MGFIYIIKNDINDKVYIGKTLYSQEKRFKAHCADSIRRRNENRPQYRAMNKYGTDHFYIELVEECFDELLEEREIFWIKEFDSYKNGYNATIGGDGKMYLELPESAVCAIYLSGIPMYRIAKRFNCDPKTIHDTLVKNKVSLREGYRNHMDRSSIEKSVEKIDQKTGEVVVRYSSIAEAERVLGKPGGTHIHAVCKGKRKSSNGFGWRYV